MRISPEAGAAINLRIAPPAQSSPIDEWFDIDAYDPGVSTTKDTKKMMGEPRESIVSSTRNPSDSVLSY
ncbi:hypothetical protein VC83_08790 [Pseudogymnoascus destructans]|uniref:Uncharacterized protein n=1 Tax=Pseudogymnoascus destructans TaxID=655981 RepID=A0A177A285_9PEZI|nr:uncharacterized protein VC83_08790 [Pseudogymnoascus destructans]OAF55044.1 hypothetical protein VC83_08790 [Pseudogymnoascus destructans]